MLENTNKSAATIITDDAAELKQMLDRLPEATKAQLLCVAKGMEIALETAAQHRAS